MISVRLDTVTISWAAQHTELVDLQLLPMPAQYPSHRLVDLDDADGRTPLRRTDQLLKLPMMTTIQHIAHPGIIELNVTLTREELSQFFF